jgi:deoxyribonuclease-4
VAARRSAGQAFRSPEEVALGQVHAQVAQRVGFLLRFDAFGDEPAARSQGVGDKAVARRVEWIERLFEVIGGYGVGFVLDTCHLWAGGEPLDEVVPRIMAATGRIDLVQVNDSKDPFDSRRDRHENLGRGMIPPEEMAKMIIEAGAPVAVETPGGVAEQSADIEWVRSVLGS